MAREDTPLDQETFDRVLADELGKGTDRRVAEGRAVAPSFLLASLLWHDVLERWQSQRAAGEVPFPALQQAVDAVFDARIGDISGRGKLAADMREIWSMQPRFERRTGSSPNALVEQPRFRAGYDFLRLRADAGEVDAELAEWWEDFSLGDADEREALLAAARQATPPRRVPRAPPATVSTPSTVASPSMADDDAPVRKRRRRRRKGTSTQDALSASDGDTAAPPKPM